MFFYKKSPEKLLEKLLKEDFGRLPNKNEAKGMLRFFCESGEGVPMEAGGGIVLIEKTLSEDNVFHYHFILPKPLYHETQYGNKIEIPNVLELSKQLSQEHVKIFFKTISSSREFHCLIVIAGLPVKLNYYLKESENTENFFQIHSHEIPLTQIDELIR